VEKSSLLLAFFLHAYLGKTDVINPNPNAIFSSPQVLILSHKIPKQRKKKKRTYKSPSGIAQNKRNT